MTECHCSQFDQLDDGEWMITYWEDGRWCNMMLEDYKYHYKKP